MKFTLTAPPHVLAAKEPEIFARHVGGAQVRATEEVARAMRKRLSRNDAFGTLTNSIRAVQEGPYTWLVAPGVNYARMVEEGTGPAAGRASYFPRPDALMRWLRLRSGLSFRNTKPGSTQRRAVAQDLVDRAWALARSIEKRGTRPHPFIRPTAETMRARVLELHQQGVRAALQEIASGRLG